MISLPNELLYQIIHFTDNKDLGPYLFVCKHTFHLVRHRVYRKVLFPDTVTQNDIITFCENYGSSIETIKLPLGKQYPEALYRFLLETCPNMDFLQSSIQPKQLNRLIPLVKASTCFMVTHLPLNNVEIEQQQQQQQHHQHYHGFYSNNAADMDMFHSPFQTVTLFPCCPSFFIFPNEGIPEKMSTLTQISHYFHHPGALSNAILPTFGSDLLSLTLNPYDILTASVARLIVSKCPRLRYLGAPSVKAEGLWMLLRWCQTLSTIIVGEDDNLLTEEEEEEEVMIGQRQRCIIQDENERAVATVKQHKRVWCVHSCVSQAINERKRVSWHIGIVPKC